jgi:Zn-finger nucleic acid-binding protein
MAPLDLEHIEVDHCTNCGSTFFDENEINRITLSDALYLSRQQMTQTISGEEKHCPRDKTVMLTYQQESIPQHVTLLHCEKCGGIFTFADDLVTFKKAQSSKINYYKDWNIPAPKIQNFVVLGLVGLIVLSTIYLGQRVQSPTTTQTQATGFFSQPTILKTDQNTVLCFTTKYALKSDITFTNTKTGMQSTRVISALPQKTHCASIPISQIPSNGTYLYKLLLKSDRSTIVTEARPFVAK